MIKIWSDIFWRRKNKIWIFSSHCPQQEKRLKEKYLEELIIFGKYCFGRDSPTTRICYSLCTRRTLWRFWQMAFQLNTRMAIRSEESYQTQNDQIFAAISDFWERKNAQTFSNNMGTWDHLACHYHHTSEPHQESLANFDNVRQDNAYWSSIDQNFVFCYFSKFLLKTVFNQMQFIAFPRALPSLRRFLLFYRNMKTVPQHTK